MDKIKLSELRAARAAMTPGPWTTDDDTPSIYGGGDEVGDYEIAVISQEAGNYEGDGPGIVATHNAADALIEIVEALIARRAAVRARVEIQKSKWSDEWQDQDDLEARYQAILANEQVCGERLERALAEVDP